MSISQNLSIDLNSVLMRYRAVQQREYQKFCIEEVVESINKGVDILINLPTGTGKTLIYAPIVMTVSESGRSVLILTATKAAQKRVSSEIKRFNGKSQPTLIYGIQEYYCPVRKNNAQNWCCSELKEDYCKPSNLNCDVISSECNYASSNLVVTNFSKFLLASTDRYYDLIILDDSHSFENLKEQVYQINIRFADVRRLYESGIQDAQLESIIEAFLNIFSEIFERCVSPNEKEGIVGQEYISLLAKLYTQQKEDEFKKAIINLPDSSSFLSWEILYFIRRCKSASKYQFYIRKDFYDPEDWDSSELISRRNDLIDFVLKKRLNDSRIIFVTATPGDIMLHAKSCAPRKYDITNLKVTPSESSIHNVIDNWFVKLSIIIVDDIGDTRQPSFFEKAIRLTTDTLKNRKERALILFKNYRDQRTAKNTLSKMFPPNKLLFIDGSLQDSNNINEYASKTQISLASASSTLWEAINIRKLRLAIIISPPFIRPPVGQRYNYQYLERRMLIRLQQGIGRIIRNPKDFGVAILIDSRFKRYINRRMFDERLRRRVEIIQSNKVVSKVNELFIQWSGA